jgi:hypothetical protein
MSASQYSRLQAEPAAEETGSELLDKAEHARRRYQQLNQEHTRLLNDSCDSALAYPDRALSLKRSFQTHRAEREAFESYMLAQTRFRELTLGGK